MGNCQAAEAATVVIEHPGSTKIERIHRSVSARQVMNSNPGHFVALVITSQSQNGTTINHLKLLRPCHTLLIGHVYRLITFEDVLKEFAAKKCVKLGKLLKETGGLGVQMKHRDNRQLNPTAVKVEQELHRMESYGGGNNNNKGSGRQYGGGRGGGQWRPALQSIAEIGT